MHAVILWLATFTACLIVDFVIVRWLLHVTRRNRVRAALYSGLCEGLRYATTFCVITNYWLIVAACLGAMVGTVLAMGGSDEPRTLVGQR